MVSGYVMCVHSRHPTWRICRHIACCLGCEEPSAASCGCLACLPPWLLLLLRYTIMWRNRLYGNGTTTTWPTWPRSPHYQRLFLCTARHITHKADSASQLFLYPLAAVNCVYSVSSRCPLVYYHHTISAYDVVTNHWNTCKGYSITQHLRVIEMPSIPTCSTTVILWALM